MSKFFKALEQAEQDRALREQARAREGGSAAPPLRPAPPAPLERPPVSASGPAVSDVPAVERAAAEKSVAPAAVGNRESAGSAGEKLDGHLVSLLDPISFAAEQYRGLRYMVEHLRKEARLQVVGVTSPGVGDGKTTTTVNLAGALAQAPEARVLLVDADLRRPSLARHLGMRSSGGGLVDAILKNGHALRGVEERLERFNLSVLPAGQSVASPYELLKSPRLAVLMEEMRRRYDYIVVDTPPLLAVPDCRVIGKWVDGFIVVVAAHKTPHKLLEEALNIMEPTKTLGLVFNHDDRPLSGYYDYYCGNEGAAGERSRLAGGRMRGAGSSRSRLRSMGSLMRQAYHLWL